MPGGPRGFGRAEIPRGGLGLGGRATLRGGGRAPRAAAVGGGRTPGGARAGRGAPRGAARGTPRATFNPIGGPRGAFVPPVLLLLSSVSFAFIACLALFPASRFAAFSFLMLFSLYDFTEAFQTEINLERLPNNSSLFVLGGSASPTNVQIALNSVSISLIRASKRPFVSSALIAKSPIALPNDVSPFSVDDLIPLFVCDKPLRIFAISSCMLLEGMRFAFSTFSKSRCSCSKSGNGSSTFMTMYSNSV